MEVYVTNGEISDFERQEYINCAIESCRGKEIERIDITIDGDYVVLDASVKTVPFDRIRRITGYLVGTTQRFNDAKRVEERDRVKHSV